VKPQPLLQEILYKKLNFTLVCLVAIYSFKLASHAALQAAPQTPASSSKSTRTTSKPAKKSGVKSSSKTSTRKKTASRSKKPRRKVIRGQRTIESARVVEIQNALAAAGYYKQEPSGQWDDSTTKAMSAYQQDNGFRTTGKPDALSLTKLGL
jgi:peptidoglycan hydrolase-like protein with peptidoglycan-binding domain